ncbi:MAG: CRISPR-associated protein Cas4, partial [Gemmatimonadaceae bacterium]
MPLARGLLLLVAICAAGAAAAIPILLRRLRTQTGFTPDNTGGATIIASDTGAAATLIVRDENVGVCGKPDYVVQEQVNGRRLLVPVEVKPTRRSRRLYDSDRLQLGVYLLGLRAMAGDGAADFGYVRYAATSFQVRLTDSLEREIQSIVLRIGLGRRSRGMHRNHGMAGRCRACAVRP